MGRARARVAFSEGGFGSGLAQTWAAEGSGGVGGRGGRDLDRARGPGAGVNRVREEVLLLRVPRPGTRTAGQRCGRRRTWKRVSREAAGVGT